MYIKKEENVKNNILGFDANKMLQQFHWWVYQAVIDLLAYQAAFKWRLKPKMNKFTKKKNKLESKSDHSSIWSGVWAFKT